MLKKMDTKIKKTDSSYIEQLTWLRGLAAFFVIVSHTSRATEVTYSPNDEVSSSALMSLFDLGSFGVVLFFVLSGCTLYISNSDKVGSKGITTFYIKRFFRIWPVFVISIILYMAFRFVFSAWYAEPQGHWIERQFLLPYSIYDVFSYFTFTFNLTGPEGLFNNAYWSLPVEFQYYLIFPIIIASLKFGALGPISLSIALYFLPKFGLYHFDSNTVFQLAFSFCGGILVGYIYEKKSLHINTFLGLSLFFFLMCTASAIGQSYITLPDLPIISGIWNWYGGIAIVSVFIALTTRVNFHNKIELFLKHYGTISYSTYLYHNLFVAISVLIIINFEIYDKNLRLFITFFFTLFASYLTASVSYKYIEKPSIAIGRSMIKKYNTAGLIKITYIVMTPRSTYQFDALLFFYFEPLARGLNRYNVEHSSTE